MKWKGRIGREEKKRRKGRIKWEEKEEGRGCFVVVWYEGSLV